MKFNPLNTPFAPPLHPEKCLPLGTITKLQVVPENKGLQGNEKKQQIYRIL